jgi:hypothetical protein
LVTGEEGNYHHAHKETFLIVILHKTCNTFARP